MHLAAAGQWKNIRPKSFENFQEKSAGFLLVGCSADAAALVNPLEGGDAAPLPVQKRGSRSARLSQGLSSSFLRKEEQENLQCFCRGGVSAATQVLLLLQMIFQCSNTQQGQHGAYDVKSSSDNHLPFLPLEKTTVSAFVVVERRRGFTFYSHRFRLFIGISLSRGDYRTRKCFKHILILSAFSVCGLERKAKALSTISVWDLAKGGK